MSEKSEPKNDAELEQKDTHFKEVLQPRLTLLLSIVAILVALFSAFSKGPQGVVEIYDYLKGQLSNIIIGSNILVSAVAFVLLALQPSVRLIIRDKEKFKSLAELPEWADVNIYTSNLNNRVGKLVGQFQLHMILFAGSLVLVYTIIALTTYTGNDPEPGQRRLISFFPVATNLMNLLGALFVHWGFFVLYNKTLVAKSESSKEAARNEDEQFKLEATQNINYYANQYWAIPALIVVPYILIFITLAVANLGNPDKRYQEVFLNIADLLVGSYNGLAMSLLFGRYVSIEQLIRNTKRYGDLFKHIFRPFSTVSYKTFVTAGIVFVLPIYALAQPLFGNLKIEAFGDVETFQTWVFGICLLGKICFFHLTYILISKGILHLYLYGLASSVGNFKELDRVSSRELKQEVQG